MSNVFSHIHISFVEFLLCHMSPLHSVRNGWVISDCHVKFLITLNNKYFVNFQFDLQSCDTV